MEVCGKFATACILGVLGSLPQGPAEAAELVILTNQGVTPGVREVAAAFERSSGNKVTVIQEVVKHWEGDTMTIDITRKVPPGDAFYQWYGK
jgi:hypothetical protein